VDGKSVENNNQVDASDVLRIIAAKVAELVVENALLTAQLNKIANGQ
jgi:hypothetical protein